MLFRYEKTTERRISPAVEVPEEPPARLLLWMVQWLDMWFDGAHKTIRQTNPHHLQIGYPSVSVPTMDFAEACGPILERISRQWPTMCISTAENDELVGWNFQQADKGLCMIQSTLTGRWYETTRDLYLVVELPDEDVAGCMVTLLQSDGRSAAAVAFDWKDRPFLEAQHLIEDPDPTLSFCYVQLTEEPGDLAEGLSFAQKEQLWTWFLQRKANPREFEWVWSALSQGQNTGWTEWALALYQAMDALGFQCLVKDQQFQLLDGRGERIYFSVDHRSAAERVLMKILFPLNL